MVQPGPQAVLSARSTRRLFLRNFGGTAYLQAIKALPCAICLAPPPSDFAHTKSRGAGGDASKGAPLCRPCHRSLDAHQLPADIRDSLLRYAAELWDRYSPITPDRYTPPHPHREESPR